MHISALNTPPPRTLDHHTTTVYAPRLNAPPGSSLLLAVPEGLRQRHQHGEAAAEHGVVIPQARWNALVVGEDLTGTARALARGVRRRNSPWFEGPMGRSKGRDPERYDLCGFFL